MPQNLEETVEKPKYTYEMVLEQLGGYEYFDKNTICYIYHSINGETEIANIYLDFIIEEKNKIAIATEKLITSTDNVTL